MRRYRVESGGKSCGEGVRSGGVDSHGVRVGVPSLTEFSRKQANSPRKIVKMHKSLVVLFCEFLLEITKSLIRQNEGNDMAARLSDFYPVDRWQDVSVA
jgi:hypothetical protein